MGNASYEFDVCSLDGSDQDELSIDNWKPSAQKITIKQSEWRKNQIGNNYNQQPALDDLRKINMYLNKKSSDAEIMQVFGINAETLIAIKKDNYSPVDGIHLDTLGKIYNHFKLLENKIVFLENKVKCMVDTVYPDKESKSAFTKAIQKKVSKKKSDAITKDEADDEEE